MVTAMLAGVPHQAGSAGRRQRGRRAAVVAWWHQTRPCTRWAPQHPRGCTQLAPAACIRQCQPTSLTLVQRDEQGRRPAAVGQAGHDKAAAAAQGDAHAHAEVEHEGNAARLGQGPAGKRGRLGGGVMWAGVVHGDPVGSRGRLLCLPRHVSKAAGAQRAAAGGRKVGDRPPRPALPRATKSGAW